MKNTRRQPRTFAAPRRAPGPPPRQESRGLVRALVRRGSRSDHGPAAVHKPPLPADPTLCAGCRAVFTRKTWRRSRRRTIAARLHEAPWSLCPACRQVNQKQPHGCVRLEGTYLGAHADEIRRRILNVGRRAEHTQPERRLVAIIARGPILEVLTTSQELAHRVAHELKKAFHGTVSYAWSDRDEGLLAVWRRD